MQISTFQIFQRKRKTLQLNTKPLFRQIHKLKGFVSLAYTKRLLWWVKWHCNPGIISKNTASAKIMGLKLNYITYSNSLTNSKLIHKLPIFCHQKGNVIMNKIQIYS